MADKSRIAELDKAIKDTRAELATIQQEKQAAANDPERLVLAEKRGELESKLKHLAEMRERVNALPVYPEGAIMEEWAAICERALPDWKKAVLQVETLAAEYKAACAGLLALHDTLQAVREDIKNMAEADGQARPYFARCSP